MNPIPMFIFMAVVAMVLLVICNYLAFGKETIENKIDNEESVKNSIDGMVKKLEAYIEMEICLVETLAGAEKNIIESNKLQLIVDLDKYKELLQSTKKVDSLFIKEVKNPIPNYIEPQHEEVNPKA